jgi:imidazole glycerol-phosphate synthase subunit HisH
MSSVAVIDYGMGNLHSIAKALQHAAPHVDVHIVSDPELILKADRVVFPGVGAMRDCMQALNETQLAEVIKEVAKSKPLLGICLGMQALLTDSAENGCTKGLDILPGYVVRFSDSLIDVQGNHLKVPHMGWNQVHFSSHPLWDKIQQNSRFYFVHSYYAIPNDATLIAATTEYPTAFACALAQGNVFAVQFHPEKSQAVGLQLLNNFLHWDGHV